MSYKKLLMGLVKPIEQNSSKKINNNGDVRVLIVRGSKITINIANIKSAGRKLSTMLIKIILLENKKNVKVKKI